MENEQRVKTTLYLTKGMVARVDGWRKASNCGSRNEFIERALQFYMGYLSTEDVTSYLSEALVDTLQGIVTDNSNRMRSLLFKMMVELNMTMHTVAAHFKVDEIDRRELRRFAIDEVKRTNGQISFDRALDIQRQLPAEEEWHE